MTVKGQVASLHLKEVYHSSTFPSLLSSEAEVNEYLIPSVVSAAQHAQQLVVLRVKIQGQSSD